MPLDRIWDEAGEVVASKRVRYLSSADIRRLLKASPIHFVVADVGSSLQRISVDQRFEFWKQEVQTNLVNDHESGFHLEEFPNEYAYIASEWRDESSKPIVLLERYH